MVSSIRRYRTSSRGGHLRSELLAAAVLAALALATIASAASASGVNIVRQGDPPAGKLPKNTHYYKTIQEAVD